MNDKHTNHIVLHGWMTFRSPLQKGDLGPHVVCEVETFDWGGRYQCVAVGGAAMVFIKAGRRDKFVTLRGRLRLGAGAGVLGEFAVRVTRAGPEGAVLADAFPKRSSASWRAAGACFDRWETEGGRSGALGARDELAELPAHGFKEGVERRLWPAHQVTMSEPPHSK